MRKVPKTFLQAVATHRNRLEKVLTASSAKKMKSIYDEAQGEVSRRLKSLVGTGRGDTFTAHQKRMVLAQLRQGQAMVMKRLSGNFKPLTEKAQQTALKGLVEDVSRLHKAFTGSEITLPIEEASTFAGVVKGRSASLLRANQSSFANYGAQVVQTVERKLAVSLLKGQSPNEAIDDVNEILDTEWWRGERIVRTELAYAYNATHRDGMVGSAKEIPELMMRWEEHCDDTGAPLDDRVGVDSIAMHGQVAAPGDDFTMPATAPHPDAKGNTIVSPSLVGLSWDFPPNRPNDRAVLSPWMADWGVPGWEYKKGSRVWL